MKRTQVIFWTDMVIFCAFLIAAGIGFSLFLSLKGDLWKAIHLSAGVLVFTGVILHLVLHRKWIRTTAKRFVKMAGWHLRINFCVDCLLGWVFLLICLSGLNRWLSSAGFSTLFQIKLSFWEMMHRGTGIAMTIYVALHLALHGRWIRNAFRNYLKTCLEHAHSFGLKETAYNQTERTLVTNISKGDVP